MSSEKNIFIEATAAQVRKAGERELKKTQKENKKEEKTKKDSEWYRKQLEANLSYKRERLEWQKERSLLKDKLRRKREQEKGKESVQEPLRKIKTEVISDKDKDPTAYQKSISSAASLAKGLAAAGIAATKRRAEKKRESENKSGAKIEKRTPKPYSISFKSSRKKVEGEPKKLEGTPERKKLLPSTKKLVPSTKRLQPSGGVSSGENRPPAKTLGQRARNNPELKKRLIASRSTAEEFSCWREEFLYELGELRKNKKIKNKEENTIDVMKGKNTVIVGPKIDEEISRGETVLENSNSLDNETLNILEAKKREKLANALLGLTFATSAAQSPKDFVRTGHIESPGAALMQRWGRIRNEAERNLDSGRVSHPSRNIKNKKKVYEECDCENESKKQVLKSIISKLVNEKKRKNYLLNSGIIGEEKLEEVAAWQRKEGKSESGGLNEKGRKSYEREHPGSDLKRPQPKGGSRRDSFCARMKGMKKKLTSAKTANDPDSRINKSLRAWNC